ncbi:MAG: hypothetical protein A2015_09710 [Spirochaetes bacterium GWF1_31_7]|nr:MAG: hypothetical protein A2Y30_04465 [Spirochaetes bacterium GWE1_32_154]OHD47562.1 MAG: hypothetical protein A2015_09710 [Spirochaetes bacterium GWF1_31_7]OHD52052.1 MAG: hypothetical protein A2Y29_17470 [Spirochaetes bacterium GWE2_31_10]HBD93472.1 hypothetical protein [Spirochaetia bacterium]HBI36221.1 hypothetical protein [Spirochaetia bacterium]
MKIINTSVIIIGAGPIGLLLANLLGKENIETVIIDKKKEFDKYSKAIGIMPPSFKILKDLNILDKFLDHGVKVKRAVIHGSKYTLGDITFKGIKKFECILSNPQNLTENILFDNLKTYKSVTVCFGHELKKVINNDNNVEMSVLDIDKNEEVIIKADIAVACDGGKSTTRNELNIDFIGKRYKDTFVMGDYIDKSDLGSDAHLFFTKHGAVESFPLNDGKRRWVVQTEQFMSERENDFIEEKVLARTGIKLEVKNRISDSPFGVQHYIIKSYSKNRVIFCGDAAHLMSPIGGQGMNTGFADVEFTFKIVKRFLKDKDQEVFNLLLKRYDFYRRKAAKEAILRASLSMWIGTIKGGVRSLIRNINIFMSLHSPLKLYIPIFFAMMTIKYHNVAKINKKDLQLLECYDLDETEK